MEDTLTIPKNQTSSTVNLLLACGFGLSSAASAMPTSHQICSPHFTSVLPSGANSSWVEKFIDSNDPVTSLRESYIASIQDCSNISSNETDDATSTSDVDTLLKIKELLSLTAQQLAKAMGVSRASIYHWIDGTHTMNDKNNARLNELRGLAELWLESSGSPVARTPGITREDRIQLVKYLDVSDGNNELKEAWALLKLHLADPQATHRNVLDTIKEKKWSKLPDHVKQGQLNAKLPAASIDIIREQ